MAVIKRPQYGDGRTGGLVQILLGALLGGVATYLVMNGAGGPTESSSSPSLSEIKSAAASTSLRSLQSPGVADEAASRAARDDGWHQVNVYYGERSGLGAPETQEWFAQVHQDEIVLDLIGPDGYFIDLAANDAKDLTNTLALERHGWKGLCVEPNPG
jgi:hypothetical protein